MTRPHLFVFLQKIVIKSVHFNTIDLKFTHKSVTTIRRKECFHNEELEVLECLNSSQLYLV